MNTKNCPNCSKELPQESVFCPYCMTKLIDVETGNTINTKTKNHLIPVLIISVVVVIAICAVVFFVSQNISNSDKATESITNLGKTDKTDYSSYIGLWCDKGSNINKIIENGGNLLEIISVNDNVIRFTFTKTSLAPHNRIARISNVATEIIDGVGNFTFDNDSWLNSGIGKIKLLGDEIYLETTILNANEDAMWHIGGRFNLTKSESSIIDFKNYDYLGADFDEVKNQFGEKISETTSVMDIVETHYYSGLTVNVDKATNTICYILVTYSGLPITKSELCYGEINGNSRYDDVYRVLGEPWYNNISNYTISYIVDGGTLNFTFDENMNISSFALESDFTN